ncbi:MAG: hypothetical protein ABS46_08000 [Cytophagaceae bacterium SCN 52-12]|nr:MAG: hypothetical protein ABS46_08000 [Cytophagaceae bacterium SCN 52-12]
MLKRPRSVSELKRSPKDVQAKVKAVIETLLNAGTLESSGVDYKLLEGQKKGEGYYRIRVGGWRIGIRYIHPDILIITVMARGDIYKHFPPK